MNQSIPKRSRAAGLSLIELMIAMALGIIIVAAMSELFVNISRSNQEMAKTNSQIENARFAMQYLREDIVHAGYWGGFVPEWDDLAAEGAPGDTPLNKIDPCLAFGSWNQAYADSAIGIPVEVFSVAPSACGFTHVQANTDVVVVRHAETCAADDPNCDATVSKTLYFQASNCDTDISVSGTPYSLLDPNDYGTLTELDCSTAAKKRKWVQNIYYIRDHAVSHGDGIPTLMRSSFGLTGTTPAQQSPDALVEGIERFHVELGFDRLSNSGEAVDNTASINWDDLDERVLAKNRGNGLAEGTFERCLSNLSGCTATDLANVVAVKLYVLARATDLTAGYTDTKKYVLGSGTEIGPFDDSFKRHAFSTTIRLNNVAGRRETSFDPNNP